MTTSTGFSSGGATFGVGAAVARGASAGVGATGATAAGGAAGGTSAGAGFGAAEGSAGVGAVGGAAGWAATTLVSSTPRPSPRPARRNNLGDVRTRPMTQSGVQAS